MHLHAAFVPPPETVAELADLVRREEPVVVVVEDAPSRRGLFGRRVADQPAPATSEPQLQVLEPDRMLLPITDLGYLASGDARRVGDALEAVCAALAAAPTVRLHGGAALVDPDDRSVWVTLDGSDEDLDAMQGIAQAVVAGVEPLGYFRDRRQFKPRLAVATITDATTVEHLEQVLAALDAYEGSPWLVDEVILLQRGAGVWRTLPVAT